MQIELFPLEKAVIDGHVVSFGMEKAAVEAMLGVGEPVQNKSYYFDSNLCIEYDANGTVVFLEVSCDGPDGTILPVIYGEDVTKRDAQQLFQILQEKNHGDIEDEENGHAYTFYNLSVGVYRGLTLEDYNELVEEMKANGIPVEDNPDLQADFWKATHWATIGIGAANYYR